MPGRLKMGTKIALGFLFATILLLVIATVTLIQVQRTVGITNELIERDQPMSTESLRVLNGVNESLAALRGWMLIENDRFRTDRAFAWSDTIEPAFSRLKSYYGNASESTMVNTAELIDKSPDGLQAYEKVLRVEQNLAQLKVVQQQIEDIAQTDQNRPALQLMLTEATPAANQVFDSITALINAESVAADTPERKPLITGMADFRGSFSMGLANVRGFLLDGNANFDKDFQDNWATNQRAFDAIRKRESMLSSDQQDHWEQLKTARADFAPLPTKIFELRAADDWNKAVFELSENASPLALSIRNTLESLLANDLQPAVFTKRDDLIKNSTFLKRVVWLLAITGVLASLLCGWLITTDFNRLGGSIKSLLSELSASSQEINAASQQQVASMTESATSINEISSTAEEFKATIQEFVDRARAVREAAEEMSGRASDGLSLTQATALKNDEVRISFEAAGESILKLSQQMQQITQITASVSEIAEQTKLLALNASIEAARAGEEGRGFAVVATQVRELANQSREASNRIASQISEIQDSVQTVIRSSSQGNEKLSDANQMGVEMANAFQEIVSAIEQTTDAMRQMDQAARQQEAGMSDLVNGIAEIDTGTKETLTTARQNQQAISAVEDRSRELARIVARLKD